MDRLKYRVEAERETCVVCGYEKEKRMTGDKCFWCWKSQDVRDEQAYHEKVRRLAMERFTKKALEAGDEG